jgi:hypothetical protein
MPRKIEQQNDKGSFECLVPDQLPELFVDGVSQIAVAMPVTRIVFHATVPPQELSEVGKTPEQRVAKLSLVIPTAALMELVANIASNTTADVVTSTNAAVATYTAQTMVQMNRLAALTESAGSKS